MNGVGRNVTDVIIRHVQIAQVVDVMRCDGGIAMISPVQTEEEDEQRHTSERTNTHRPTLDDDYLPFEA